MAQCVLKRGIFVCWYAQRTENCRHKFYFIFKSTNKNEEKNKRKEKKAKVCQFSELRDPTTYAGVAGP